MAQINDVARRQLACYARSCLTGSAAHFLEAGALSQLDVLRGEIDADEPDFVVELPAIPNRGKQTARAASTAPQHRRAPRGDQ